MASWRLSKGLSTLVTLTTSVDFFWRFRTGSATEITELTTGRFRSIDVAEFYKTARDNSPLVSLAVRFLALRGFCCEESKFNSVWEVIVDEDLVSTFGCILKMI